LSSWSQSVLWTIEFLQVLSYFKKFPKDHWGFRLCIVSLAINETLALISLNAWVYRSSITDFGIIEAALLPGWEFRATLAHALISATLCQSYLVLRFRRVSQNNILSGAFAAAIVGVTGLSLYTIYASTQLDETVRGRGKIAAMTMFGMESAVDVGIAAALALYLIRRMKTDMDRTQRILRRLVFISIESGTVTAFLASATLIAVLAAFDTSNLCFLFLVLLGRSYALTLLFNINLRGSQDRIDRTIDEAHTLSGKRTIHRAGHGQVSVFQLASDPLAPMPPAHVSRGAGFQVAFSKDTLIKMEG